MLIAVPGGEDLRFEAADEYRRFDVEHDGDEIVVIQYDLTSGGDWSRIEVARVSASEYTKIAKRNGTPGG
ncbi:hypothetical protein GCM10027070_01080 [Barrientosiimonas humi]